MNRTKSPFRSNISNKIKGPSVVLFILLQSFVSGITRATAFRVSSFYGLEFSTVIFFTQLGTIGMVSVIPIFYRLRSFFRKADLLYIVFSSEAILSLLCLTQNNSTLLLISNFFFGMLKIICLFDFISLLVGIYPVMKNRALFYGIYYTIARAGGQLSNIVIGRMVEIYDWRITYVFSFIAAILCIGLCSVFFHRNRLRRKIPLYQVEWKSMLLFVAAGSSFCYILTLGKTKDWFDSIDIIKASIIFIVTTCIFIYRQYHIKRPYWNLRIFRLYQHVITGILLMFIMYLFTSTNVIVDLYTQYNFNSEENYISAIAGITFCTYIITFPVTGWLLYRKVSKQLILCIGFIFYSASLFYFYHVVQTSLSFNQLIPVYLLQGMAYGFTITTLSTFTSTNVQRKHNAGRVMSSLSSRYIIGSFAGFSLYTNWLYRDTSRHKVYLSEQIANLPFADEMGKISQNFIIKGMDYQTASHTAISFIEERIGLQAMLTSIKEITFYMAGIAVVIAIIVLFMKKLSIHEISSRNQYNIV